jgi:hypothetical protein
MSKSSSSLWFTPKYFLNNLTRSILTRCPVHPTVSVQCLLPETDVVSKSAHYAGPWQNTIHNTSTSTYCMLIRLP